MVKIYKQPFAHDGDAIAIPDASQPDGKMSRADGWTPDYQLLKTDPNYKPVGRQEMNGVFKEVTEALGQMQVQGAASWSADGTPYPVNAQVYHNGKQWIAMRANSVEPAEGDDWAATVERGSNVNGEYVKFAGGTLICTMNGYLLGDVGAETIFTFPHSFSNTTYSETWGLMSQAGNYMNIYSLSQARTLTSITIVKSSEYEQVAARIIVIGRWD